MPSPKARTEVRISFLDNCTAARKVTYQVSPSLCPAARLRPVLPQRRLAIRRLKRANRAWTRQRPKWTLQAGYDPSRPGPQSFLRRAELQIGGAPAACPSKIQPHFSGLGMTLRRHERDLALRRPAEWGASSVRYHGARVGLQVRPGLNPVFTGQGFRFFIYLDFFLGPIHKPQDLCFQSPGTAFLCPRRRHAKPPRRRKTSAEGTARTTSTLAAIL